MRGKSWYMAFRTILFLQKDKDYSIKALDQERLYPTIDRFLIVTTEKLNFFFINKCFKKIFEAYEGEW